MSTVISKEKNEILSYSKFNQALEKFKDEKRKYLNMDNDEKYDSLISEITERKESFIKKHFEAMDWFEAEVKTSNYRDYEKTKDVIFTPNKNIKFSFSYDGGRFNAYFGDQKLMDTLLYEEESVGIKVVDGQVFSMIDNNDEKNLTLTNINAESVNGIEEFYCYVSRNFHYIFINGYMVYEGLNPSSDFCVESSK